MLYADVQSDDAARASSPVLRVIVSVLATTAVSGLMSLWLISDGEEFRAAALVAALTALTSFVAAVVLVVLTHRLIPGLWGYVPGFVAVLVAGLWLGESNPGDSSGESSWLGYLVVLNPLFWVPIYVGLVLLLRKLQ